MNFKILLYSILISTNTLAQSSLLKQGEISQNNYLEIFDFEIFRGKMIVPIQIEGKNYRFLFDTGAPNTLNSSVFKSTKKIASLKVSDSNEKEQSLMLVNVPSFKINTLEFKNFNFLEYDFTKNFVFNCLQLDGIIGSNSFINAIVKIDYPNKKIYVTDKIQNLEPQVKPKRMKLLGNQASPYLELTLIGNKKVYEDALFDTGYNNFYVQSNRAFTIFNKEKVLKNVKTKKAKLAISLFGSDNLSHKSIFTIPGLHLGNSQFTNVVAYTSDDNNSKLGTELLNYGTIILDFIKSRYYFEPKIDKADLNKNYPLFTPSFDNNKLIIGMVIDDKLENEIKIGYEITSVDGHALEKLNCENIFNFPYPKEKFSVKEGSLEKEIILKNYE